MIECRYCHAYFNVAPERIGARCPECRMPLFERPEPPAREVESGNCAHHVDVPAQAACKRCRKLVCLVCRTRWNEEMLCLECVRLAIQREEPHPRDVKAERGRSMRGFVLALTGWLMLLVGLLILVGHSGPPPIRWSILLLLMALVPALFALGVGVTQTLGRFGVYRLAVSSLALSSAQLGITTGLLILNFVRN
jgi:hypothetical protein